MADLVADLNSDKPWLRREAERSAQSLRSEATITDGVIRWNSNNQVPPADCVALAAHLMPEVDIGKCAEVRDLEVAVFLAEYRENFVPDDSPEARSERRAAFGPGETVVNIITGHRYRT